VREGLFAADFRNLLAGVIVPEDLINIYLVDFLQDSQFSVVGCEDGPEAVQLIEEFGAVAEIVYTVCIEDYDRLIGKVFDEKGKELLHVAIAAQARPDDPAVDGLLPAFQLGGPFFSHDFYFLCWKPGLFLGHEHWMDDNFRGV
jgi:hypothetical protein